MGTLDAMQTIDDRPGLREKCGVFGVWGAAQAAALTHRGLISLQHRGQESAGISVVQAGSLKTHKGMGLVTEVFAPDDLQRLTGSAAIGHVRYSTTGQSEAANAQPLVFQLPFGPVALAHNGNLVNAVELRQYLESEGAIFQTTTDTEVIAHLMARVDTHDPAEALRVALAQVRGAYALVVLTPTQLLAARDPLGIRPLQLGALDGRPVVASESCAFDAVGARLLRDVVPGELARIDAHGLHTQGDATPAKAFCIFEYIYFARPDSRLEERSVYAVRKELGRRLAKAAPVEADVVIGVPEASLPAGMGYAEASGIPFELGLVKNRYLGRTFIQPQQAQREASVRLKLNPVREAVAGRRVVLVDDSIVRGTTARRLVQATRAAGATEVHLRITAPPYSHPCHYGIDTSLSDELASRAGTEALRRSIGADSLAHLPLEEVAAATEMVGGFCDACFTGRYPVPVPRDTGKNSLTPLPLPGASS